MTPWERSWYERRATQVWRSAGEPHVPAAGEGATTTDHDEVGDEVGRRRAPGRRAGRAWLRRVVCEPDPPPAAA